MERQIQEIGGFLDSAALRRAEGLCAASSLKGQALKLKALAFLSLRGSFVLTSMSWKRSLMVRSQLLQFCFFDCVGPDDAPSRGQSYRPASQWLITSSPVHELDFVLLRLAGQPDTVAPSTDPNGPPRGFLVPKTHDFLVGEPLVIIQHPGGRPRRFAVDRIKRVQQNGTRIAYAADTDYGSSGSPCFTATFDLVALHQGFYSKSVDPEQPNKGIPFNKILEGCRRYVEM